MDTNQNKDSKEAFRIFYKIRKELLKSLQSVDFLLLSYKDCKQLFNILKGLSYENVQKKSRSAAEIFLMLNHFLEARIGTELYGEGRVRLEESTHESLYYGDNMIYQ